MEQRGRLLDFYVWSLVGLILLPIAVVIPVSFNTTSSLALPVDGISWRWYASAFADARLLGSFGLSLLVAACSTGIALALGAAAAYVIARRDLRWLDIVFLAPIAFPAVVLGGALLLFFAPIGLVRTIPGLVVAHVVVVLPYVVRTMVASFRSIDPRLEEAATILGAGRMDVTRHVLLPLAKPGLISAACFAFIISFDEFSVSLFLVGTSVMTLPIEMYQRIQFIIDPTVAAASSLLLLVSIVFVFAISRLVGLRRFFVGS